MDRKPHIIYKLLALAQFPKFVQVYKQSFVEIEGFEPKEKYMGNWMAFVLQNINNLNFLFLSAQRGKKVVGILVVAPMTSFSREKQALVEPMYIIPEYKQYSFIAVTMVETAVRWMQKKGYETVFVFENPDSDKWEKKTQFANFKFWKKLLKMEIPKEQKDNDKEGNSRG